MQEPYAIIVFDGECAFCDRSVKWIIARDKAAQFRFAARQSEMGQRLLAEHGLPPEGIESLILIDGPNVATHSTAVLKIAGRLGFPWKLASAFLLIPQVVRDWGYRALAKRRYKIAGKLAACSVPTDEQRAPILA